MTVPEPLITTSPDRLSRAPVFAGTRVPVQTLLDYIEGGQPLEEFLDDFPSVTRDHAIAVLKLEQDTLHVLQNRSLMEQIERSLKTHREGTGYRPSPEELDVLDRA